MRKHAAVVLVLFSVVALAGCASMQVRLGMKVDLTKTPITSMNVSLPKGTAIAPGQKSPLVVTLTEPDGKVLQTEGAGRGKVMWKDLQVVATVVKVNTSGVVSLPGDPRVSDGKAGHIIVTVPSQPGVSADLDIPFRYDIHYTANFFGSPGSSGFDGTSGINGTDGMTGSLDPNNPSPGGNGTDGTNGSDGQDGSPGGNAPAVDVRVAVQSGSKPLLQVSVLAAGKEKLYLVDPNGGSVTVNADGGAGGTGGRGGRGGRGGSGGIGTPNGMSGNNGLDGHDGSTGPEGRGGEITVTYDPQAEPFLHTILISNRNGPKPVYREQPLSPLW